MSSLKTVYDKWSNSDVSGSIRYAYENTFLVLYEDVLRDLFPVHTVIYYYNTVKVPAQVTSLDKYVPLFETKFAQNKPDYEEHEIKKLQQFCSAGDDVVIIGGGLGVSAVRAAEEVGSGGGTVNVYEASQNCCAKVEEVVAENDVEDRVEVHHSIVGEVVSLSWSFSMGGSGGAERISGDELPDADIYEIDCEGAEMMIIDQLTTLPEYMIVETHSRHGSPKDKIVELLNKKGQEILDTVPSGRGVHVVTAVRDDSK